MEVEDRPRYTESLNALIDSIRNEKLPNRSFDHECTVQETVVKASGLSMSSHKSIHYFSFFKASNYFCLSDNGIWPI